MKILGNRRQPKEKFKKYRARLEKERQWIKSHLKGHFGWISKKYSYDRKTNKYIPSPGMTFRYSQ